MADGITVAPHFYEQATIAVHASLMLIPFIKDFVDCNNTIDEAIEHYNMRAYVTNAINVEATNSAYNVFINNILNERTFAGEYADNDK